MKKIIIIAAVFMVGCGEAKETDPDQLKQEVIKADKAMSDLAATAGFNSSILTYADSNIVKLNDGQFPIIGKTAFAASFNKDKDVKTISWSPVNAEVARSDDLGYSWGTGNLLLKTRFFMVIILQYGRNSLMETGK
ncbi:MAG: hypothetical protein IPL50_19155 [Chitinophagaceae bacterium]|nr:hypothetical protein [Chitinophagaceae bacterium]